MIDDKFIAEVEGILPLVYDDSLSYYEVLEKVTYLLNECIQKVNNIADPVVYTPTVNEDGTISWTNNGGLPNPEPVDISGPVGPAPSISVTDITGGHRITIVDEYHPDGINIDVMNGAKGEQGDAGVSPAITITDVLGGHRITITDAAHPQGQSFNVMNGDKGDQGDAGVSPTVTITDILGGHRITITDETHPQGQNFDVMNGAKGDTGAGVPAGGNTDDVLVKNSNTDYDAKWTKTPAQMGSLANIETSPISNPNGYNEGDYIVYNGQLYRVTAAIAAGQTLTVGTNIEAITVATAIKNTIPTVSYGERNTTNTSAGTIIHTTMGKIVLLQISLLKIVNTAAETVLASGLPASTVDLPFILSDISASIRVGIFKNGQLKIWWGNTSVSTTAEFTGLVLYQTT